MYTVVNNSKKRCGETDTEMPQYYDNIREILDRSGLNDVMLTNRILRCFQTKLTQLLQKKRISSKRGGKQLHKFIDSLRKSKPYEIKIYVNETEKLRLHELTKDLIKEKTQLEQKVESQKNQCEKLLYQLAQANAKTSYWQSRFKGVVKRIMQQQKEEPKKKRARKSLASYSQRSKYKIKKELKSEIACALEFIGMYDLVPSRVTYYDPVDNKSDTIVLIDQEELCSQFQDQCIRNDAAENADALDNVHMLLYIKDKFNISNRAWHELASLSTGLPSNYSLKQRLQSINKLWEIFPTPGDTEGVQISLCAALQRQVKRLLENKQICRGETMKIKISGDGTNVGKCLQLLNVAFSIINEGPVAAAERGTYVLLIAKTYVLLIAKYLEAGSVRKNQTMCTNLKSLLTL